MDFSPKTFGGHLKIEINSKRYTECVHVYKISRSFIKYF